MNCTTYSYDGQGRLYEASVKHGTTQVNDFKYRYDWSGNLTSSTLGLGATPTTYTYNAANELTSSVQGSTTTNYSYDADGNLSGWSSGGLSFSYNSLNQTTAISGNNYSYSGSDQTDRVQAGSTSYVYSFNGISSQTDSSGTTYYTRCSCAKGTLVDERTPSGAYYYLFDGLGSIVGLTDSNGTLVSTYQYDPYGNLTARAAAVRRYFTPLPRFPRIIGIAIAALIGLILVLSGLGSSAFVSVVGLLVLIFAAVRGVPRILDYRRRRALAEPKPSDDQMDQWLMDAFEPARRAGFRRLDLEPSDLLNPDQEPLLVVGFPQGDGRTYKLARGKDGRLRASHYDLLVVYMTEWHLSTYQCTLDMETGALGADETHEFAYRDIVSVATTSDRVTFSIPLDHTKTPHGLAVLLGENPGEKGEKKSPELEFTSQTWFRLRVASDEIKLCVYFSNFAIPGVDDEKDGPVDGALQQIRGRLREYTRLSEGDKNADTLRDVRAQARHRAWPQE